MSQPTIFLSAATDDLKDWRELLHRAFSRAGCMVYTQDQSFGPSTSDVLQLLRDHLDKSDFIIHLAGLAYGAEPEYPAFADHPAFRCSYTQFEYYYAQLKGKKVIAFVCAQDFPYKQFTERAPNDADREVRRKLQLDHRERVTKGRFAGTPLEGHPHRPKSESVSDANAMLAAVAAAVGTIHTSAPATEAAPALAAAQKELLELSNLRFNELLAKIQSLPEAVGEYLRKSGLVRDTTFQADISRIVKYAPTNLIGREKETAILSDAWAKVQRAEPKRPHVLTFVALGGEGKTSLVAKWAAELSFQDWPGCDAVFAWSFYSQGTRDQSTASSDSFLKEALKFFGDTAMAESAQGAFDKYRRLAQLVGERRSLLILDGLEPLQYAPTSPTPGELKDRGLAALLKDLAAANRGLCVVTTRYTIPDLRAFCDTTAPEERLTRLSKEAGVALLRSLGVIGTQQAFERLVEAVKGHALTLNLLGSYLHDAHGGDIRKRDLVNLEEADAEEQGGHAFRVMDAYVRSFESEGEKGKRALAMLRLLGLFDRPASADCIDALHHTPVIKGLTEPLVGISETQRNLTLARLESARLLTAIRDATGTFLSLDAHPLLREYFAQQLRTHRIKAWRAAHKRLYEHLCATTPDKEYPELEDLQPLYQAIVHGCQAELKREALNYVYLNRTQKGTNGPNAFYSTQKLGAFGADLGAVACFFDVPWSRVSPSLTEPEQSWLVSTAAFDLQSLGRLLEAVEPFRAGLEMDVDRESWRNAAISCRNMCLLRLALGEVAEAVKDAEQGLLYSERSHDDFSMVAARARLGDALHQAGQIDRALKLFQETEALQRKRLESQYLYSLRGVQYCDVLLSVPERVAWQITLSSTSLVPNHEQRLLLDSCLAVSERATTALRIAEEIGQLSSIGLDHLTLSRTELCASILSGSDTQLASAGAHANQTLDHLRHAGDQGDIPPGLLTRAWLRSLTGNLTGSESSQRDLDDAWEIASAGPMRLHLADIHLHRARLFFREKSYPWKSPQDDLAAAEKLINDCGYHRRDAELDDAKRIIREFTE